MTREKKTKKEFPLFTRIEIIENELGYFLKCNGVNKVLDITFKSSSEAIQHAISKNWIIITGRRYQNHVTYYDKVAMVFKDIINFQWISGKAKLLNRLLRKYPSNLYPQYPGPESR